MMVESTQDRAGSDGADHALPKTIFYSEFDAYDRQLDKTWRRSYSHHRRLRTCVADIIPEAKPGGLHHQYVRI